MEKSVFRIWNPATPMMHGMEKEKIPVKKNWEIGTCRSIDYPKFSNFQPITKFEDYGKKEKKFSGFIAYRNQMELSKDQDRRYILFIPEAGENDIRIEVATTLERERGANKGKQAPIGIYSTVKIYQI